MRHRSSYLAVLALGALGFAACNADRSTAVTSRVEQASDAPLASKADVAPTSTTVKPMHRKQQVSENSVSQTIGPAGGTLSLPGAGAALKVPAGALLVPVRITMSVLPGDVVAYEFAPHGLIFLKPATLEQQLGGTKEKGTSGGGSTDPVELGYFGQPSVLNTLFPKLDELRGGTEVNGVFSAPIWHFSGYAVSCGRY
jgi:hypothetical protein